MSCFGLCRAAHSNEGGGFGVVCLVRYTAGSFTFKKI